MMQHGKYIGKIAELKGETAMLREDPFSFEHQSRSPFVLAQFDKLELTLNGANLAHGWHLFEKTDFEEIYNEGT